MVHYFFCGKSKLISARLCPEKAPSWMFDRLLHVLFFQLLNLNNSMPIYCFSHYFIDISMITVFKQFFYCIFSSPFMIILLVRFYIQKSFQQVKAKYLDFKTKKQLLAIHLVIQLEITKLWLYLLLLDTKSDIKTRN